MDYKQIKQYINDMEESKLTELSVEFPDGTKISMKKGVNVSKEEPVKPVEQPKAEPTVVEDFKTIKSPMVGTFYSKSAPTAKPYVEVGSTVKKGDIVCVIEAMKLMNEIEADVDGKIVEICVNDGEIVDYGKVLFKIK